MKILPSKSQWKNWSLPSKASYIGTISGVVGLLITITVLLLPDSEIKIEERIEEKNANLNEQGNSEFLKKLANPLPNQFIPTNFTIKVKLDSFAEYLPDLRKQIFNENLGYRNYDDDGKVIIRGIDLNNRKRNKRLLKLFENKNLSWSMRVYSDNEQINNGEPKFLMNWWFRDKLSFNNLDYRINYEADLLNKIEYFKITKSTATANALKGENYITYTKSSISSILELCDRTVLLPISIENIDEVGTMNGSNVYFESITFKDNNSKSYRLKFLGHHEIFNQSGKEFISKTIFEQNQRMASLIEDEKVKELYKSVPKINFPASSMSECVSKFSCLSIK